MLKSQYLKPSIQFKNYFSFPAFTQYGLTALTECDQDACPDFIGNTYTLGFHICAEGISSPSDLNDAAYSTIYSCPQNQTSQSDQAFSNCRADEASCPDGTIAVICDLEVLCANSISNCFPEDFGVTDNGEFIPCPAGR
jgi:hypothetical protein